MSLSRHHTGGRAELARPIYGRMTDPDVRDVTAAARGIAEVYQV